MKKTIGIYRFAGALWGIAASIAVFWQIGLGQKYRLSLPLFTAWLFLLPTCW